MGMDSMQRHSTDHSSERLRRVAAGPIVRTVDSNSIASALEIVVDRLVRVRRLVERIWMASKEKINPPNEVEWRTLEVEATWIMGETFWDRSEKGGRMKGEKGGWEGPNTMCLCAYV